MFDKFFHHYLKLPYRLNIAEDINEGLPIIFLHGIASSSDNWVNVLPNLKGHNFRLITLDLLGFGKSPKPAWSSYDINEHSKNVAYTIKKLKLKQKPIIVGHSMGCLIAVNLVYKNPTIAKQLLLLNMPIYLNQNNKLADLDENKINSKLNNVYFSIYDYLANNKDLTLKGAQKVINLNNKNTGFTLDENTWLPFRKSLLNTIKNQNSLTQITSLKLPITITYGRFDLLVISKYLKILSKDNTNIKLIAVNYSHEITPKYGKKISELLIKEI